MCVELYLRDQLRAKERSALVSSLLGNTSIVISAKLYGATTVQLITLL